MRACKDRDPPGMNISSRFKSLLLEDPRLLTEVERSNTAKAVERDAHRVSVHCLQRVRIGNKTTERES